MFPSRSSRTQYVLFPVKLCFALKVSMEGPNPFSFRRGSFPCQRKRQIPLPPSSSVCQKPPSRSKMPILEELVLVSHEESRQPDCCGRGSRRLRIKSRYQTVPSADSANAAREQRM